MEGRSKQVALRINGWAVHSEARLSDGQIEWRTDSEYSIGAATNVDCFASFLLRSWTVTYVMHMKTGLHLNSFSESVKQCTGAMPND